MQEAGLAPGPVWTGAENLTPTVIRSPDRPARSQLYTDYATRPTDNMRVKRPEFGILPLIPEYARGLREISWRFRMNIEQFYRLSQLVGGEIRKQNTNYRRAISPDERLSVFF